MSGQGRGRSPRTVGRVVAVVLAGGAGTRFGAGQSKVYVPLGPYPILGHSLHVLDACVDIDDIVVVVREGEESAYEAVAADAPTGKVRAVVPGGATRQGSERSGLDAVAAAVQGADLVVLHDAARPFLTLDLIADLVGTARRTGGGAIPAQPVTGDLVDGRGRPIPSADLVSVQTPQVFPLHILLEVYPRAMAEGYEGVDTAQTVQAYSDLPVAWVDGDVRNVKVTHPEDLDAAEALLPTWDRGTWRS